MKVMYFSDLHLRMGIERDVIVARLKKQAQKEKPDLILNAGDISNVWDPELFLLLNRELSSEAPYVSVMGNHDFYLNNTMSPDSSSVEVSQYQIPGFPEFQVVFGTLWTDYFGGDVGQMNNYICLNDVNYIPKWSAQKALKVHRDQLKAIASAVDGNPERKTILLTHHAISTRSISPKFESSTLNGSFVNQLDGWILDRPNIVLAVHGHVHQSFDYKIGNCRVLCHPRGYPREENYGSYEAKFVEI